MRARIQSPVFRFLIVFALLLLIRVPFYFTHHVQEDAYISLRCAENLAETGVYGFNPGEKVSSSTSHLYVFLASIVRLVAGHSAFLPAMLVLNTILFLAGTFFIARVLLEDEKQQLFLWVLISLLPVSLLISYSGMETALLVFLVGSALSRPPFKKPAFAVADPRLAAVGPPDAVAYALLIVSGRACVGAGWTGEGQGRCWAASARCFFQPGLLRFQLLHQSINAKLLMRHSFSLHRSAAKNVSDRFCWPGGWWDLFTGPHQVC